MGKDDGAKGINIYARVRTWMPWEAKKELYELLGEGAISIQRDPRTKLVYNFSKCFDGSNDTEQCFKVIAKPVIARVLEGFNGVMVVYGQTGSGKSYTMLGSEKENAPGFLPRGLTAFIEDPKVEKLEFSAVESYGIRASSIMLYDLLSPLVSGVEWNKKKGKTSIDLSKLNMIECKDRAAAVAAVAKAVGAAHYAPTGKNPNSSRGHCAFITKVCQNDGQESHFVAIDLAGSEGDSALTPSFIKSTTAAIVAARRMEGGVINVGLAGLQMAFQDLKRGKDLSKGPKGQGLRRILNTYISTSTELAVVFTLSPSADNAASTVSTMKFAKNAGMIKVKPVKVEKKAHVGNMLKELESLKATIMKQRERIKELEEECDELRKGGAGKLKPRTTAEQAAHENRHSMLVDDANDAMHRISGLEEAAMALVDDDDEEFHQARRESMERMSDEIQDALAKHRAKHGRDHEMELAIDGMLGEAEDIHARGHQLWNKVREQKNMLAGISHLRKRFSMVQLTKEERHVDILQEVLPLTFSEARELYHEAGKNVKKAVKMYYSTGSSVTEAQFRQIEDLNDLVLEITMLVKETGLNIPQNLLADSAAIADKALGDTAENILHGGSDY